MKEMQINTSIKDTNKCSSGINPSLKRNIQKIMHPHNSIKGNTANRKHVIIFISKIHIMPKVTHLYKQKKSYWQVFTISFITPYQTAAKARTYPFF